MRLPGVGNAAATSGRVAVVGLGLLGRGIAACFLAHGFETVALERNRRERTAARREIAQMIDELIRFAGFDCRLRNTWPKRCRWPTDFRTLRDCSFVVESVTESVSVKNRVLDQIEANVSPDCVIASNSSAIPISRLQCRRRNPGRFIGMHWAEPAHATRFLELVRGKHTSTATLRQAERMAELLGKEPAICQKELPGFIVNRVGYAMYREVLHLLETGVADADTIDTALRNTLGLWATVCGPLRWMDLTGGPELYARAMKPVLPTLTVAPRAPRILRGLAARGARGIANGRGFYHYTAAEARRWKRLYRQHSWRVRQLQQTYFPLSKKVRKKASTRNSHYAF